MEGSKKIEISGTANRYAVKKLINNHKNEKEIKKRVVTKNWNFENECYEYSYQINLLKIILDNNNNNNNNNDISNNEIQNEVTKTMIQEINKKIYNYKQQDILKKKLDESCLVNFNEVIDLLINCGMKCVYCSQEVHILYERVREMKQWSLDRINNDIGHNSGNLLIACLECNLKRRRTNKDAFMFTKNMVIIKENK